MLQMRWISVHVCVCTGTKETGLLESFNRRANINGGCCFGRASDGTSAHQ